MAGLFIQGGMSLSFDAEGNGVVRNFFGQPASGTGSLWIGGERLTFSGVEKFRLV